MDKDNPSYISRIYKEVLDGYSKKIVNKFDVYFKHPTLSEHFIIYSRYNELLEEAKSKGVLTEKEKIDEAIEYGWWQKDKEFQITVLRQSIKGLNKTKNKLLIPSQKKHIIEEIKRKEAILISFIRERQDLVNYTAEDYANNKYLDETILEYSYKDKSLTHKLFNSYEEYYKTSDDFLDKLKSEYNSYTQDLNDENIKLVAASGFFQNMIFIGDTSKEFWGSPVIKCSKYQNDLLIYGKMFKNIIKNKAETGEPIKEDILNNPKLFLDFIDDNNKPFTKQANKNKSKNSVTSLVGATHEDYKKMGTKVEKFKGKSILDIAKEKGGTLEKSDYLKLRENL